MPWCRCRRQYTGYNRANKLSGRSDRAQRGAPTPRCESSMKQKSPILPYANPGAGYIAYDREAIDVAAAVGLLIENVAPWVKVEHIGSTAIPGCAGKGIVDVMVMYPPNRLEPTRAAIDALG